jgi:hypothetical protein
MSAGRTLSLRHLFALSTAQVMVILTWGPSIAGGPISNESDVLGIKLSMSRDQVKKLISDNYPGAPIVELPVELGTPEFKKSTVAGFVADITSKQDQAVNQRTNDQGRKDFEVGKALGFGDSPLNRAVASAGDLGHERVVVLYNPNDNATDIFAVARHKEFTKESMPLTQVLVESLIEKYGQPSGRPLGSNIPSFTWMAPGVFESTQKPYRIKCFDGYSGGSSLFYENPEITTTNNVGIGFSFAVNKVDAGARDPFSNIAKCGTVLNISLTVSDDKTHVTQMETGFVDLTRGHTELKEFATDFFRHVDAAKQAKISRDSQNKPKL